MTVRHAHNEDCKERADQQLLNPDLKMWFEGLMKGGLTAMQAIGVYEEAIFGGPQAGELELSSSQVLCFFISALYWSIILLI